MLSYVDELMNYDGQLKVKFNHVLFCDLIPSFNQTAKDYINELKTGLSDFEYSSASDGENAIHTFKKIRSTENLELDVQLHLKK